MKRLAGVFCAVFLGLMLAACSNNPDSAVTINEDGSIVFAEEDIAEAMQTVACEFEGDQCYDVTENRTYQIYMSALRCPAEKQTKAYLGSYYGEEYAEGDVMLLQCDQIAVLIDVNDDGDWAEIVEYPDYGYWLARGADGLWTVIGSGY